MDKNYTSFALEGYVKNVITHRCIGIITSSASYIPFKMYKTDDLGSKIQINAHPALRLLNSPNTLDSRVDFMDAVYSYKLISGNSYILASRGIDGLPYQLSVLRPDRVSVLSNDFGETIGYRYECKGKASDYMLNEITGACDVLHLKSFHPLNDYYGLSSIESARFAIDQHNEAAEYSKSLLQNSARPSGALVVKPNEYNSGGTLTDEQFDRLKDQMNEHIGTDNAGRPMILEGGLDWKEMSMSPKDMDFVENKYSAARDIALAFGIPPQLLGIPGDNTYSNMSEARLALWEQTILPIVNDAVYGIGKWLSRLYNENFYLEFDKDKILAFASKKENQWSKIAAADFLTPEEKKQILGIKKLLQGDED